VTAARVWSSISLGVFLLALAVLIQTGAGAKWILVIFCATSAVGAFAKGWWRWGLHPLLWGAAFADHFLNARFETWALVFGLLGASLILSFVVDLLAGKRPPSPPPAPRGGGGSGVVIDAEIR
jgi:hypothetical protein